MDWKNRLFFGDNLDILREYIPDASVDLIYPIVTNGVAPASCRLSGKAAGTAALL